MLKQLLARLFLDKYSFFLQASFILAVSTGRGVLGGAWPQAALLVVRRGPTPKSKNQKLKRRFFYFEQKKKTSRKGINKSQLAIRNLDDITGKSKLAIGNFNDITGRHMNTSCAFLFLCGFP